MLKNNFLDYPIKVAESSYTIFTKSNNLNKCITLTDFVMQVYSTFDIYLIYTGIRCGILLVELSYADSPEKKAEVFQKAQLYASTKCLGLVLGQIALLALGLTNPLPAALILSWGLVLFSISSYAYYLANSTLETANVDIISTAEKRSI